MKQFLTRTAIAAALMLAPAFTANATQFDELTVTSDVETGAYERIHIAPVEVSLDPNTRRNLRDIRSDRPVSERDQARNAEELHDDLKRVLSRHYEIVDTPGEGTLTVDATITRLVSTRPTLADFERSVGLDFSSVYAGGADFRVELREGDVLIATIEDSRQTFLNDGRPRVGVWQDADYVFSQFSRNLSRYVRGK